ncbi:MAG TPA: alanine racemase [Steroidobacteraceae bacterium]|nr:alanine racemase [Steroidobacteraceae bacterium]
MTDSAAALGDIDADLTGAPAARLTIELGALADNYRTLVRVAAPSEVAAVVKADAYGLGLGPVAERLAALGCRSFFVTTVDEGVRLRHLLPECRVFVLHGAGSAIADCREARLTPVLNTLGDAREWAAYGAGAPAAIQVDTGITRAGLDARDVARLAADPPLLAALRLELLLTQLACADDPSHPLNAEQVARFAALRARLPAVPTSIGNSAGTLLGPEFRGDVVRPGIALYGGRPFLTGQNPMRPVVRLEARVLQVRDIAEDAWVGYGATWHARAPARIATVGAGYADGYPRALGGRGFAFAAGRRLPVVGRVSMDLTTIDVTELAADALRTGDYVDLLGGGVPLEEAATLAGTISYELLTGLAPRLARRWC